jgi:hypothetical protein
MLIKNTYTHLDPFRPQTQNSGIWNICTPVRILLSNSDSSANGDVGTTSTPAGNQLHIGEIAIIEDSILNAVTDSPEVAQRLYKAKNGHG